jgi:GTP-binding protein HflX
MNIILQKYQVAKILEDIGADKIPTILVMNKIDCLENTNPRLDRDELGRIYRVWISGQTGEGVDLLYQALAEQLSGMMTRARIKLDVMSAYIRSEIHNIGYIHNEKVDDFGRWILEINVTNHYLSKLLNKKGVELLWEQNSN